MPEKKTKRPVGSRKALSTDLLIIGGGAAGTAAAFAARNTDPSMRIVMISDEKWTQYSAPALPDYLSGELTRDKLMVRTKEDYENAGIVLYGGDPVEEVDAAKHRAATKGGMVFEWKKLIFAIGSFPIRLRKMQGTDLPGNFVNKTIDDIDAILAYGGKRAVVVGSGAIGLEGSMALKARGFEDVVMVEALDWLSPKSLDRETSDELTHALEGFGVRVLTGEAVQGVLGKEKVEGVVTSKREIPCDLILWGIGMRQDTALAVKSGVELGELGGIRVDEHMQTNLPDVYACGDCIESFDRLSKKPAAHLFWEPAQRSGMVAGENCAGMDTEYNGSVAVFLTHKGGLAIVGFGKTEADIAADRRHVITDRRGKVYRRLLFEDGVLVGAQMVNTIRDADLMLDYLQRNAVRREGSQSMVRPLSEEELSRMTVTDCIRRFRNERRTQLKY